MTLVAVTARGTSCGAVRDAAPRCENEADVFSEAPGMLAVMALLGVVLLVALVAGAIYQRVGVARDARRQPPPGRLVDVGGRRLHLYCLGDGPASVIFEAGLAASSLSWRPVQEAIAPHARACAYDRAGYGWSDRAPGSRDAGAAAADLRRLLRAAGLSPPHVLVVHSFGAYVALRFAADQPTDVAGLVFVDPLLVEEWLTPDRAQRHVLIGGPLFSSIGAALAAVGVVRLLLQRTRAGSGSLPAVVLRLFGREADAVVRRIVGEVTKLPPALWPAVQAHWSRPRSFLAMAQHFRALVPSAADLQAILAPDGPHRAALHEIPMIVVSAANCTEDRVRGHRLLASLSRHGTHICAPTGGHWVHLDQPAIVIDAVHRMIAARQRASTA